jgi:hypothetical protein
MFAVLGRAFAGSANTNLRYLGCYCEAMIGMMAGDASQAIGAAHQAAGLRCSAWLRRDFPLPLVHEDR